MKRTILTAPDSLGRVLYIDQSYDPHKPYCGVCRECEHSVDFFRCPTKRR